MSTPGRGGRLLPTYRILGPLEIDTGAGRIDSASPRRKAVIAALLLEANAPVSVDRLIEAVWDDDAPATARNQLQNCVSRARKELAGIGLPGALATRPPGYLMSVEEGELDLHVFEWTLGEARRAAGSDRLHEAAALYEEALSLWRGTPLADVTGRLIRTCAERLTGRRLGALEERVACELALNRHRLLVEELEAHAAEHPMRESLQAMLMTALQGSGRRAEALEIYRRTRVRLVEELGIEPGEELRTLHRTILRDGDVSAVASRMPAARRILPVRCRSTAR
ncbi:BTAD domain-containing putative transcriptional regulator [Actinoplanes sp. NPDC049681]|uniref:AfsR/SARP family transcriptional regulator n=1 Tax=Actinoplanes sp. NPDC049681 TaxID=3363905 RepID=UPI00378E2C9F